jgi:hypothetical protein
MTTPTGHSEGSRFFTVFLYLYPWKPRPAPLGEITSSKLSHQRLGRHPQQHYIIDLIASEPIGWVWLGWGLNGGGGDSNNRAA